MKRSPMKRTRKRSAPAAVERYWDSLPDYCQACWDVCDLVIHHLLAEAPGKLSRRDHMLVNRLCARCHNMGTVSVHLLGSEAKFEEMTGVDLVAIAVRNRDEWMEKQS